MGNTVGRQFCISQFQKEVINGCLLGDGRLECRSKEGSARLRIHHGWKQKELVFWKYETLKNLVSCPPRRIVCWKNLKNNEDYYSWYFHTLTLKEFREFYQAFYWNGDKRLPKKIVEIFTPVSLAVWIMDDGCNTGDSLILNTQSYSLKEQERLKEALWKKYRIFSTINKDRDKFRLRFNSWNASKIIKIIIPHIIPSMRYKIVPVETESVRTR
ncbi:hypothetical protein J7K43_08220 [Candidatus Calescamantes bacterium]|nr:hypothetical protein [Candidatus Calescamantes bacterium]